MKPEPSNSPISSMPWASRGGGRLRAGGAAAAMSSVVLIAAAGSARYGVGSSPCSIEEIWSASAWALPSMFCTIDRVLARARDRRRVGRQRVRADGRVDRGRDVGVRRDRCVDRRRQVETEVDVRVEVEQRRVAARRGRVVRRAAGRRPARPARSTSPGWSSRSRQRRCSATAAIDWSADASDCASGDSVLALTAASIGSADVRVGRDAGVDRGRRVEIAVEVDVEVEQRRVAEAVDEIADRARRRRRPCRRRPPTDTADGVADRAAHAADRVADRRRPPCRRCPRACRSRCRLPHRRHPPRRGGIEACGAEGGHRRALGQRLGGLGLELLGRESVGFALVSHR